MGRNDRRPTETLPLSASPVLVAFHYELARGPPTGPRTLELPPLSTGRDLLRALGRAVEGSALLIDDRPVPLDAPLPADRTVVVVPTFSGG